MALEPPGAGPPGGGPKLDAKWIIGGVVVLGVLLYYIYSKQSSSNSANAANNPSALNVNAEIAPTEPMDQFPYGQLALPGYNTDNIDQVLNQYASGQPVSA